MRVPSLPDRNVDKTFTQAYFDRQWTYLAKALNSGTTFGTPASPTELALGSSVEGSWFEGMVEENDTTVRHTLNRVPTGFIVVDIDKPSLVYRGSTQWTKSSITLRSSIANTHVKLLVI